MNRYENSRPSSIIKQVTKDLDLNISALAKEIGMSHTNLYFYFTGQRKWNLESWLETLSALGRVSVSENRLKLDIPIPPDLIKHLRRLKRNQKKFIKPKEPSPADVEG